MTSFSSGGAFSAGAPRAAFSAYKSVDQTGIPIAGGNITFDTETFDIGGKYAASIWTPPAGLVRLHTALLISAGTLDATTYYISIRKNGVQLKNGGANGVGTNIPVPLEVSCVDVCNGTDAYSVFVSASGGTTLTVYGSAPYSFFEGATQ